MEEGGKKIDKLIKSNARCTLMFTKKKKKRFIR